jgi:hypothetical protein
MGDGGTFLARMLRGVSPIVECSLIFLLVMFLWTLVDIAERGIRYISAIWQLPSFPEGDCRLARAVGVGWHPGDRGMASWRSQRATRKAMWRLCSWAD